MSDAQRKPLGELLCYLRLLAGEATPGQHLDVRWARPRGPMCRRFVPALRVREAARLIARLAPRADVYVGVALREGRADGGRGAIAGSHLLYVECDDPDLERRLGAFPHPPTLQIASGTPGHAHLYWLLCERAASAEVERANRRLAQALGGDQACADIARVLRPPGTLNHKHRPARAVQLLAYRAARRYGLTELVSALPTGQDERDSARCQRHPQPQRRRPPLERALLEIPAAHYARVLAGLVPNRAGKVLCPFHEDTHASLQLYGDGSFYCFGSDCHRGGTIIDFAAALWGLQTHGAEFLELRRRLAEQFGAC